MSADPHHPPHSVSCNTRDYITPDSHMPLCNSCLLCSKGAIAQLTRVAALDVGKHGIRVNAVCPGPVLTRGTQLHAERWVGWQGPATRAVFLIQYVLQVFLFWDVSTRQRLAFKPPVAMLTCNQCATLLCDVSNVWCAAAYSAYTTVGACLSAMHNLTDPYQLCPSSQQARMDLQSWTWLPSHVTNNHMP